MPVYPEFEFLKSRNGNIVAAYPLAPAKLDLPKFRDIPGTSKNFGIFFAYGPGCPVLGVNTRPVAIKPASFFVPAATPPGELNDNRIAETSGLAKLA